MYVADDSDGANKHVLDVRRAQDLYLGEIVPYEKLSYRDFTVEELALKSDAGHNIYTEDGTISDNRLVTIDSDNGANKSLEIFNNDPTNNTSSRYEQINGSIYLDAAEVQGVAYKAVSLDLSADTGIKIKDTLFSKGAVYDDDYSGNFTDRSIIDKGYADNIMNRSQVTGLLSGGEMSLNAVPPLFSTTLDITAGSGQVVDYSDPTSVILTPVSWDAYNASSTNGVYIPTPANLANDGTYVLAVDSSGTISEIVITAISTQDTSDKIMIGAYVANGGVVVAIFATPFNTGYGGETTATDFIRNVIGPANIEGNVFGANGANLNLDLVGGRVFLIGSNFRTNTKTPDELSNFFW